MKLIWYHLVKLYITIGFAFYYKKIIVKGLENIPKNKAVMFISNHPNALIDPLLIATTDGRNTHYLTQAGVFSNKFVKKILFSFNMIPVYRIRDGYSTVSEENEKIFQYCYSLLKKGKCILIFAEGSHNMQHKVRPLRKGFARIVFGAIDTHNDLEIDVIPVGVNYTNATNYGSKVSICYGKPMAVKPYWNISDRNKAINKLKEDAFEQLKLVTSHIEDLSNYDKIIQHFERDDFLFPEKVNKKLETLDIDAPIKNSKIKNGFNPLLFLVKINSVFPLLIWNNIKEKIKEREYIATFKFALGISLFPIFYFIQTWIISFFFGSTVAYTYLFISFLSIFVLTKTKLTN